MNVTNKVVVITGGAQGLGLSMALGMAKQQAKLALVDLHPARLNDAAAQCHMAGAEAKSYIADISNESQVEALFKHIMSDFGRIDVLINNAGITRDALLIKAKDNHISQRMSLEEWNQVINVNLTGVFLCGREAASKMIENNTQGLIINISSISKEGNLGQTNYSASKAGVAAMTVTWAKELSRYGIRCAGIAPGFMATDMVKHMKPEALDNMTKGIPLKRLGKPEEIAQTALYIMENDYVNGRVIEVDGGLRL